MSGFDGWGRVFAEHPALASLLALMVADIVSGFIKAFVLHRVSSTLSRQGMARKAYPLLLVGATGFIDSYVELPLVDIVSLFFALTEVISIIENAAQAGVPIPSVLRSALIILQQDVGTVPTALPADPDPAPDPAPLSAGGARQSPPTS